MACILQEREKEFDESVGQDGEVVVPGETNTETGLAGKKSVETVKAVSTTWLSDWLELV